MCLDQKLLVAFASLAGEAHGSAAVVGFLRASVEAGAKSRISIDSILLSYIE